MKREIDIKEISEGWNYELTEMDYIDISSTEIREGTKNATRVEGYIEQNGLYKI